MRLNPLWDIAFAATLLTVLYWYYTSNKQMQIANRLRQFFFYLGIGVLALMVVGPVPHAAVNTFWVHMIQHISIMMVISPLLILVSPFTLLLSRPESRAGRIASRLVQVKVVRLLFHPEVGFAIFLTVLILTHFSPLANAGMRSANIHCLELIFFLLGGILYYYSVMEGNPQPHPVSYSKRVISLFAMMVPETMTGFFLYSGNRVLHSLPENRTMSMGLSDQHTGGAIMWAMGMLIDSMWIVLAARDWFENERLLAEAEDEH